MFEYLNIHQGPVVNGLEAHEVVYAKDQPPYLPLPTLPAENGQSAISRWHLTDEQRKAVSDGADILLEIFHFGRALAPVRMMVTDQAGRWFPKWFAVSTNAPYNSSVPEPHETEVTE